MNMQATSQLFGLAVGAMTVMSLCNPAAAEPLRIQATAFRADRPYPEYMALWREGWDWTDDRGQRVRYARPDMPLGACLHVYVCNGSSSPVEITDVLLDGASVRGGVAPEKGTRSGDKYASSLRFSSLPQEAIGRLAACGEPVWWKVDPNPVPAGGMAEVTVRLRRMPQKRQVVVTVAAGAPSVETTLQCQADRPEIRSISLTKDLDGAMVYVRYPGDGGALPVRILFDGMDMTQRSQVVADAALGISVINVQLAQAVPEASYHLVEVEFDAQPAAVAGFRACRPQFIHGMWGGPMLGNSPEEGGRIFLQRLHAHNLNAIMSHYGSEVRQFLTGEEGRTMCASLGIRLMAYSPGTFEHPLYYYLPDEPDAHDFARRSIEPPGERLGALGQWLIGQSAELRRLDPDTLQFCNVDNTYKPEQWYTYAQIADVASADPYYPELLQSIYRLDPGSLGAYTKPTYVYAVGEIYGRAAAPKPLHLILHTCRFDMPEYPFRAPTPQEKRVEVYYALAAGAKGISYWWYSPAKGTYYGCGGDAPEMVALLHEIGLLGAEVGTAGPLLALACPVPLRIEAPEKAWVRTLAAGQDTMVFVVVNDDIACDRGGVTVRPLEQVVIEAVLPAWLEPAEVFEICSKGVQPVDWTGGRIDKRLALNLGDVDLTRLVVATKDGKLRGRLEARYQRQFASRVAALDGGGRK